MQILFILFILSNSSMQINPFFYGNPVSHTNFIGRRKVLRRLIGRLQNGESTAITGDPHIGKTSLLNYLTSPDTSKELYGDKAERWYFSLLDVHMLGGQFTPAQFWEHALAPLKEQIGGNEEALLSEHYTICAENAFGNFTLERLFSQLKKIGQRFILLLDEFDALLHHPVLNKAEFYGGLRSLASRSGGAFTLIIASRIPLSQLNAGTQEFNPTGSPFFNIFSEVTVGPLAEKDVGTLLLSAGKRFTPGDKQIIRTLAGQHPYLLQAASAALWEAYEEEEMIHTEDIRRYVAKRLYRELDHFFSDTWKVWTPAMRKAFTAVAIAHQARLLPQTTFRLSGLLKEFHHWGPELGDLEERGLIIKNTELETDYRVSSGILLTWLADELVKVVRSDQPFDNWLQDNHIENAFLSTKEKKVFKEAVTGAAKALGQGAMAMIEAFAKGLGSGVAKQVTGG